MMIMQCSILIIVKDRHDHLLAVLSGIEQSILQPSEIIVVHMNEPVTALSTTLPLKQFSINTAHRLPLAKARNYAVKQATTDNLVFLDVDCVPSPYAFQTLLNDLDSGELVMANPLYLPFSNKPLSLDQMSVVARSNPVRGNLAFGPSNEYEMFWSLGFAITKANFLKLQGFDESYIGYGGEDTDFALRAKQAGLSLYYSQAKVFHQNHPSYDPPLNWLEDIIVNAHHFKQVWGVWPMTGWLTAFVAQGYIVWNDDAITLLRLPTAAEITTARKPDAL